jgi:hypothetical protein
MAQGVLKPLSPPRAPNVQEPRASLRQGWGQRTAIVHRSVCPPPLSQRTESAVKPNVPAAVCGSSSPVHLSPGDQGWAGKATTRPRRLLPTSRIGSTPSIPRKQEVIARTAHHVMVETCPLGALCTTVPVREIPLHSGRRDPQESCLAEFSQCSFTLVARTQLARVRP